MVKWLSAVVLSGVCVACGGGSPEQAAATEETKSEAAAPETKAPPEPVFKEVTLPVGTPLQLELKSSVASDSSKVEDTVRAELRAPVRIEGQTVLPAGTEVVGIVTDVERSGRVKGLARIAYRFS